MAERTLAENVAQVKADFKAIKDMAKNVIETDLGNRPTSEYAREIESGIYAYADGYYSRGIEEGSAQGYNVGLQYGIEQGRQAQRLEWWRKYLGYKEENRQAKYMYMAFAGYAWDDTTFDPPFDIYASNSSSMFMNSYVQDVRGILNRNNSKIIFSDDPVHNQHYGVFQSSRAKYLPYLKLPYGGSCYGWFTNCSHLIEVDGYECLEKHAFETSSGANKTFQGCTELVHIIFHGIIANTINLQWCTKLDLESLVSLFRCLKNFKNDEPDKAYTKTLTLSTESWAILDTWCLENGYEDFMNAQDVIQTYLGWNVA